MATKEEAIANINSVKSTTKAEKSAAIKALDSFYPKNNTSVIPKSSNTTSNTTTQTAPDTSSSLLSSIQNKLLEQSGIISSTNSNLEQRLTNAISGIKESADKSNQVVESQFGRELGYQLEKSNNDMINGRAAGAGGLMNMAALRELTQTTDKSIKDLEQRKQELILANDSAAASKIADLQFKALEFQQSAQQQIFSNLLGIANFGIQTAQEQRLSRQQTFQEEQAMSSLAVQFGVSVKPGDTLQSMTQKVMPFASAEQKLKLAKLTSEINANNAQAAKALKGDAAGVTDLTLPTLVNQALIFEQQGKTPADPEYGNLLQSITKSGKIDSYYKLKQEAVLRKIEEEKKQVSGTNTPTDTSNETSFLSQLLGGSSTKGKKAPPGYEFNWFGDLVKKQTN